MSEYVEQTDGGYWITGAGVSLDSIVYCFREGLSPETIVHDCFPALRLEQVYGAITYYLAHQAEIDEYLKKSEEQSESFRAEIESKYPQGRYIYERLRKTPTRRS